MGQRWFTPGPAQEETGGLRVRNRVESKAGALQALPPGPARRAEGQPIVGRWPFPCKSFRRGLVDARRDLIKTLGHYLVTSPTILTTLSLEGVCLEGSPTLAGWLPAHQQSGPLTSAHECGALTRTSLLS